MGNGVRANKDARFPIDALLKSVVLPIIIRCMPSNSAAESAQRRAGAIVLLGGSGFIGTRLAPLLTQDYPDVRIGDALPSKAFLHLWTNCDVRQSESLSPVLAGASAIINLAAEHRDDVRPVTRYFETNVRGARNVCDAAEAASIQRIVFASSAAVYGFHAGPVDENGPFMPFNAYGKTKLEAESIYREWAAKDPSRMLVIVRPTVVFGEGNRGNVYNLLRQIARKRFFMVGSGNNFKSMAYVANLAAFLVHTLSLPSGVHTFNYVDLPDMSTRQLVAHVQRRLGYAPRSLHLSPALAMTGGHVLDLLARLTGRTFPISAVRIRKFCENTQFRADKVLQSGFVPPYTLTEALDRTIDAEFPAAGSRGA
jgi:GlcNAc-P-P-Und epimerase